MINYNASEKEMGPEEIKEANRLMWMVKGTLIPDGYTVTNVNSILKSYFKRIWYNEEAYMHEEGFEDAWEKDGKRKLNLYK